METNFRDRSITNSRDRTPTHHALGLILGCFMGGWPQLIAGALLGLLSVHLWGRLTRTPRPIRDEHSNEYLLTELRRSVDSLSNTVAQQETRINRLESQRAIESD